MGSAIVGGRFGCSPPSPESGEKIYQGSSFSTGQPPSTHHGRVRGCFPTCLGPPRLPLGFPSGFLTLPLTREVPPAWCVRPRSPRGVGAVPGALHVVLGQPRLPHTHGHMSPAMTPPGPPAMSLLGTAVSLPSTSPFVTRLMPGLSTPFSHLTVRGGRRGLGKGSPKQWGWRKRKEGMCVPRAGGREGVMVLRSGGGNHQLPRARQQWGQCLPLSINGRVGRGTRG